jgi:glucose-6-phosphate dehydrogenase assembly protein OpcA
VRVRYRSGEAALAWLLGGWLDAQLRPVAASKVEVEEALEQTDVLTTLFGADDPEITISLGDQAVVATLRGNATPITVTLARESHAEAVAATLRTLGRDVCLHQALAALVRRFS